MTRFPLTASAAALLLASTAISTAGIFKRHPKKTAPAQPAPQAAAPAPKPAAAKPKAPAPTPPAPAATEVPSADALIAMVPSSGPLAEHDLILLAIANSPELERRRVSITAAYAQRRAAVTWKNPELRFSYAWQDDDMVRIPFTETSREQISTTEQFNGSDSTSSLASFGELGYGESTSDLSSGTSSVRRYREIERRVTPGAGTDKITTNIYEVREDRASGTRTRTESDAFGSATRRDGQNESVQRRLVSRSNESVASPNWTAQDQFGMLLRFNLPNPVERKALFERAAAEISLAEAEYLADEDKLVREVRGLIQDLAALENQLATQQKRREGYRDFHAELEKLNQPAFAMDKARARIEIHKALIDIRELQNDVSRTRDWLGALCGLSSPDRILAGPGSPRRVVDPTALDPAWLTDMAMIYRSDVLESRARQAIATARMKVERAARVPFASFVDGGWQRQWQDGRTGQQDQFLVRVAVELPIFNWLGINKRDKAFAEEAKSWAQQISRHRQRIESEISLAVRRLKESSAQLDSYEKALREQASDASKTIAELEASTVDINDYTRPKRMKYEFADLAQQMEIGRSDAHADYNKALMALEDAVGVRIEKILGGPRASK